MVGNRVANLGLAWTAALNVDAFTLFISFRAIPFDLIALYIENFPLLLFSKYATQQKPLEAKPHPFNAVRATGNMHIGKLHFKKQRR